jgi:hypothetical protein
MSLFTCEGSRGWICTEWLLMYECALCDDVSQSSSARRCAFTIIDDATSMKHQ